MFGRNNDNGDAPPAPPPQGPQEPVQLIPQRTFRVSYHDGTTTQQETVICRLIKKVDDFLYFADALPLGGGAYSEFVALAVPAGNVYSYREVVALVGSGLVN